MLGRVGIVDLFSELSPSAARQLQLAAIGHSAQALLTNFAVFVGGIAVTNALKAMEPVAAALLSYLMLSKTLTTAWLAALATVVGGILVLAFKGKGGADGVLVSAAFTFGAVFSFALRNVALKKDTPIRPIEVFSSAVWRQLWSASLLCWVGQSAEAWTMCSMYKKAAPHLESTSWLTLVWFQSALTWLCRLSVCLVQHFGLRQSRGTCCRELV